MTSVAPSISSYRTSPPPVQASSSDTGSTDGSDGSFHDYMSAVVSTNATSSPPPPAPARPLSHSRSAAASNSAAGSSADSSSSSVSSSTSDTTSSSSSSTSDVAAALKKLGLSPAEIVTALAKLKHGQAAAKTDAADGSTTDANAQATAAASGVTVPVPGQALGFVVDPITILTAAEQAIAAVTGAGSATTAQTAATATTTAATTSATAASTVAAAATASTATTATTDTSAAAALLAEQGVVSVTGQVVPPANATTDQAAATAASLHTIATQTANPASVSPTQAASDVAAAAIRQATGNIPMSRMSEIRAKLQAAQLGATKASGTTASTAATSTSTASSNGVETAIAGQATTAGNGIADLNQKFMAAATAAQTGTGAPAEQQAKDSTDTVDQSASDASNMPDPSLAGLGQNQASQTQTQQAAPTAQAIPITALASTLVSHAKAGDSEFNIRLDPAGLGQIDVKMKVSSDGEVRAHLIVDQPATLDLMMRDQKQLQQSLDQAGFKTDGSSLQFSLRDQGQGQNQQQAWQGLATQSSSATATDTAITPLQNAVYTRQSYVRADGVDLSV